MTNAMEYDNRSRDAVTGYYYFKFFDKNTESDKLYRFYVERDDIEYCCHPWKDNDGFLTTINVWWNRYVLGHNEGKGDGTEILRELVEKYIRKDLLKEKALAGDFNIKYFALENDEDGYDYKATYIGWDKAEHEYYIQYGDEGLIEDILNSLANNEMMILLQTHATESIAIMPVFVYEHSMISISTGSYGDPWDSGCAGFAYIEKDKYEKMCGKDTWDIELVRQNIEMEVHTYDQYLQGDVYCYWDEEYDVDTNHFECSESCGSFYSDNWGEELAMELVNDMWHEPEIITEEEAEAFIENALEEKAKRDAEDAIMAQCEYGIAI